MADLGHGHGPQGQAHATHGQQDAELGRAQALDRRRQADGQHVEGCKQAVEQHELEHGHAHRGTVSQHLQALAHLAPDARGAGRPGLLIDLDRAQHQGRQAVAEGQEEHLAVVDADARQQPVQQPQHRIAQGKTDNRGPHAGGLIEGIGRQQLVSWHQQRDRRLFCGREELGQGRFTEGDGKQGPIAPAQPQPHRPIDQAEGDQEGHGGPQAVGGHHHRALGPAVGPNARQQP